MSPFVLLSASGGEAGPRPSVEVVVFFQAAAGSGHMVGRLLAPHSPARPSFPRHILPPRRSALAAGALGRFTPMGRTVEDHGWRLVVDPPQTGPPQARLRTVDDRPQATYKGAHRPRTDPPSHAPSHACAADGPHRQERHRRRVVGRRREAPAVVVEVEASAGGRHRWSAHEREAHVRVAVSRVCAYTCTW